MFDFALSLSSRSSTRCMVSITLWIFWHFWVSLQNQNHVPMNKGQRWVTITQKTGVKISWHSILITLFQGRREDFKAFSGLVSYKLDYTPRFTSLPSGAYTLYTQLYNSWATPLDSPSSHQGCTHCYTHSSITAGLHPWIHLPPIRGIDYYSIRHDTQLHNSGNQD